MTTASAFSTLTLHRLGTRVARCTFFNRMQPDWPCSPHLFGLNGRPEHAQGQWTNRGTVRARHQGLEFHPRRIREQHQYLVAAALALAVPHPSTSHALEDVLAPARRR